MSTSETTSDGIDELLLPRRIERKVTNRNDDSWHEYDGDPLFDDDAIERLYNRFDQMVAYDYEKLFTVKGSTGPRTKIRTKDIDDFCEAVRRAEQRWIGEHDQPLTRFGNAMYGEPVGDMNVVEIKEENARKTVVGAGYQTGYKMSMGGADGKRQDILLPVRAFEQWAYHKEVVEPIFEKFNEKYPY